MSHDIGQGSSNASSSHGYLTPRASESSEGDAYDDPTKLLQVYPFATYQPIARTASHISPHTTTYLPDSASIDIYPQHGELFRAMDNPQDDQQLGLRKSAEVTARQMLNTQTSYSSSYLPSPQSYDPAQYLPYPSLSSGRPPPLPYNFMSSYLPSPSSTTLQSPDPSDISGKPPSPSASHIMDEVVNDALSRHNSKSDLERNSSQSSLRKGVRRGRSGSAGPSESKTQPQTPSHHSRSRGNSVASTAQTPELSNAMSKAGLTQESPDPLALAEPSPTKRQKSMTGTRSNSPSTPARAYNTISEGMTKVKARRTLEVVIPITPKSLSRTSSSHSRNADFVYEDDDEYEQDDDDLNWDDEHADNDGDWRMTGKQGSQNRSPLAGKVMLRIPIPGSARTGERDMRNNVQKMQELVEEIIVESDGFPSDPSAEEVASSRFFQLIEGQSAEPLLSNATLERLLRYITRCQNGPSNGMVNNEEWDKEHIPSMLRIMERSMRAGESNTIFPNDTKAISKAESSRKGRVSKKSASKSKSPENLNVEMVENETGISAANIDMGHHSLQVMRSVTLAASCSLLILDTPDLVKQLLSEDILSVAVGIIRDALHNCLIPVIEGLAGTKPASAFLAHLLTIENDVKASRKSLAAFNDPNLASIAQSCCATLPHLSSLVSRSDIAFDDQLVIRTVYLAIAPIFVAEPVKKKGKKESAHSCAAIVKTLRVGSLALLRGTFSRYEDQRQWIIEEILGSMVKSSEQSSRQAKFRLSDGVSIHTITVLLLQLIQATATGVSAGVEKVRGSRMTLDLTPQKVQKSDEESISEEARLYGDIIDSALKSVRTVSGYLFQRSGAAKSTKAAHDMDYKAILDIFINDLLLVLYRPEWPAASLYLNVLSRLMINALEDGRTGAEVSSAKGLALEYLGDTAAKLRSLALIMKDKPLPTLDDIISTANAESATELINAHKDIILYLSDAAREDRSLTTAQDLSNVILAQEYQSTIKRAASIVEKLAQEKDEEAMSTREKLQNIIQQLKAALHEIWGDSKSTFQAHDPNQATVAMQAAIGVSRGRSLQSAFEPILVSLITAMDNPAIGLRSKALRDLSSIVVVDTTVLSHGSVRRAIEKRLSDPSPSVRDAAVELVGKYVVQKPEVAIDYYPLLVPRLLDPGIAVRKRVIKLLKGIFLSSESREIVVDICCKMMSLTSDKDESVQELATKALTEMLFSDQGAHGLRSTATLLVDMVDECDGPSSVFEHSIREVHKTLISTPQEQCFVTTVTQLIERLIDGSEQNDFDALSHIRAIYILCTAQSDLVDAGKAEILLTYLRNPPANADEQASNELLLKIFKRSIPSMPRAATSFAADLTAALMPMISKPSGGFTTLKETVACLCALTNYLTHDYLRIVRVLVACEHKIRVMRNVFDTTGNSDAITGPATPIMLYICALIAENCDLDNVSDSDEKVRIELEKITNQPLHEHLYECFLDFSKMPMSQTAPSICLGALFKAFPRLILRDESSAWLKGIFSSTDVEAQARLLSVIHDFLVAQAEKGVTQTQNIDMDALIGGANLSDAGLSTAVVQRNIGYILNAARSQHPPLQNAALDILALTVNHGLYHPLQCMPILVSLETSDNEIVSTRALELHQHLHTKHPSLINVRFLDFVHASFKYQRSLTAEVSGHRDGEALLSNWYGMLGEKRAWKTDFLRQICRAFDYNLSGKVPIEDGFALYIAENLGVFEYKLQEEVMTVIHLLSNVVSAATHLVGILESGNLTPGEGDLSDNVIQLGSDEDIERFPAQVTIQASILVGLAILTKNHLLDLYSIPEDKCVKYVPGKKTAIGDKPAIRRKEDTILNCARMPLVRGVMTIDEFHAQTAAFLQILHEDGTITERDPI